MTSADASFDAVQLSLRGQLFSTTRAVLTVYPGSYFEVMLRSADMRHEQGGATREPFVIDRPPQLFSWILTLMQAEHSALTSPVGNASEDAMLKEEVVPPDYKEQKMAELKELLASRGLVSGKKDDLVRRLEEADQRQATAASSSAAAAAASSSSAVEAAGATSSTDTIGDLHDGVPCRPLISAELAAAVLSTDAELRASLAAEADFYLLEPLVQLLRADPGLLPADRDRRVTEDCLRALFCNRRYGEEVSDLHAGLVDIQAAELTADPELSYRMLFDNLAPRFKGTRGRFRGQVIRHGPGADFRDNFGLFYPGVLDALDGVVCPEECGWFIAGGSVLRALIHDAQPPALSSAPPPGERVAKNTTWGGGVLRHFNRLMEDHQEGLAGAAGGFLAEDEVHDSDGDEVLTGAGWLPQSSNPSKRGLGSASATDMFEHSDIDIFLWARGRDLEGKATELARRIADALGSRFNVELSRSLFVININATPKPHARGWEDWFGWRPQETTPLQIILRVYHSPAEVLLGFDVDCICVGFDGSRVWALPRAIRALETGVNICNPLHAWPVQPSYELRLAKYAARGFPVAVTLDPRELSLDWAYCARHRLTELRGAARLLHTHLALTLPESREAASLQIYRSRGRTKSTHLDWEATIRRTFGEPMALVPVYGPPRGTAVSLTLQTTYTPTVHNPTAAGGGTAAGSGRGAGRGRGRGRGHGLQENTPYEATSLLTALPFDADRARMLAQDPYAWIRACWEDGEEGVAAPIDRENPSTAAGRLARRRDHYDDEVEGLATRLANFVFRNLVMSNSWDQILDAGWDEPDSKVLRLYCLAPTVLAHLPSQFCL